MSKFGRSPVEAEFNSPDFVDEKDRFRGDFNTEERKKQIQMIQKQQVCLLIKQQQNTGLFRDLLNEQGVNFENRRI